MSSSNTRQVPYGWQIVDGKQVKDAAQQKVIKEILEMKDALNMSYSAIARDLQDRGVPTQRPGGTWRGNTVEKIVTRNAPPPSEAKPQTKRRMPFPGEADAEAVERDGGTWVLDVGYDHETRTQWAESRWVNAKQWHQGQEQVKAYQALQAAELAKNGYQFLDPGFVRSLPWSVTLKNGHGISEIVAEMTKATGRDLEALIEQIADQPAIKGQITRDVRRLFYEVAVHRQTILALRQELKRCQDKASAKHTESGQL